MHWYKTFSKWDQVSSHIPDLWTNVRQYKVFLVTRDPGLLLV